MIDVEVLEIFLYDAPIGTLTKLGTDRTIFAFNDDYIDNPDRLTLGLGFKDEFGELLTEFRSYRTRVMPFFSNLLPEGHLRKYLADKARVHPEREFHLLRILGRDLPGAVRIEPAYGKEWTPELDCDRRGHDRSGAGLPKNVFRFSLAGVQLKFSAVLGEAGGLTIPASGVGGDWVVKLPSPQYEAVPENEFSMMTLARMAGIDVPPIDLVEVSAIENLPLDTSRLGSRAFVIKRFDRLPDRGTVHIEDFAQIFGVYPDKKYETASMRRIAKVLAAEGSHADIAELVRRIVFNALIGNGDMHLKNWSVIYSDKRNASIAPAYDFISTVPYIQQDNMGLKLSRTKEFPEVTEDELSHFAAKAALPEKFVLDTARETVALFRESWQSEKASLPMTDKVRAAVESNFARVPIARSAS